MTKSERLLFLIRLMREHKGVSLQEMSSRCGVSARTLYRDFKTLTRLNYPIRFDNGYRLTKGTLPPPVGISPNDIQWLRLAVRLAPLDRYPSLRKRIAAIDLKLEASVRDQVLPRGNTVLQLDEDFRLLNELLYPRLLELFLEAVSRKRRVVFMLRGEQAGPPVTPVDIRVTSRGVFFGVTLPGEDKRGEIEAGTVAGLRICSK